MSSRSTRSSVLSEEQKKFYWNNGFLVIKHCIPEHDLAKYNGRFQEICSGAPVPPSLTIMRDVTLAKQKIKGEREVTKVQDFYDDDILFDYCKHPNIIAVLKELIGGENIIAMHTMLINKPPDNGQLTSRHPMHQDQHYFPFEPADNVICAWTAMQKINRANGCLVVVPGSHKGEVFKHSYPDWEGPVNRAYHGIQGYTPPENRVHLEMEAGDTVFFHPVLIHGSGANRTEGFRRAISCHYANDDVCRYVEDRNFTSDETLNDVVEMAKIKLGKIAEVQDLEIDYEFLWRGRARPVLGIKSNL